MPGVRLLFTLGTARPCHVNKARLYLHGVLTPRLTKARQWFLPATDKGETEVGGLIDPRRRSASLSSLPSSLFTVRPSRLLFIVT